SAHNPVLTERKRRQGRVNAIHYTAVEDRYLARFKVAVFNRDFVTLHTSPTGSPQVCDQRTSLKMEDSVLKMIIHYLLANSILLAEQAIF
ncbi:MAG: hypothetical protein KBT13_00685, partial [Bacteroidales bacterium]|nr:hypothetical protein [Candidatus Sodaliphilus limicaballi]